jgi:hypothetical protein
MSTAALTLLCSAALLDATPEKSSAGEQDLFNQKVLPILAAHCFKCHGPDDKARKARLRLDLREAAVRPNRDGKQPIAPGHPEESELVRRIFATEEDGRMPPPSMKNPLTAEEKEILKRWVAAGAAYQPHWAFVPPRQRVLPKVRQTDWPRNPIDTFILARLEKEGLRPSGEADRYTLVRRVYLDLIGLPPTSEEALAFVNDPATDAYEKLVDRLLASVHYGERWARRWLDLARYADTNGYEKDRRRSIWPYRDWVINSLNADMPFDRFTIDQLAGDLLPNATQEQRIATGFHRNTMLNEEGGIDPLEFRFHAMTDRVATTGTTWLGLTVGCAQCHTHKFDPITQREYYQFMAFLNNADEPEMDVLRPEITRRRRLLEAKIKGLEADLPNQFPPGEKTEDDKRPLEVRRREHMEQKFKEWLDLEAARTVHWTVLRPAEIKANLPHLAVLADNSVFASGDQSKRDVYNLTFHTDLSGITAIRLEVLPDDRLPGHGPGRVFYEGPFGDFFLSELTVTAGGRKRKIAKATQTYASGSSTAEKAIDGDPQTGWSINGGQGRAHTALFTLAEPLADTQDLAIELLFERYHAAGLGRFRIAVTTDRGLATARDIPPDVEEMLSIPTDRRTPAQEQPLLQQFLRTAPELKKAREAIDKLRKEMPDYPTTLVLQERPPENPRPTFLHNRGEFLQPTERVEPGVLSVLPSLHEGVPRNRHGFARWLISPDNPLVGRVTMNRQWAAFFGRGIVRTLQDFGYQGEPPSHPELLDWLAVEFVKRGWSMKQVHRLLVLSATYRQSSRVTPELLARDPENRLLARGPRFRLEAEQIRDTALRAAGLLSQKVGGPSVFPPQPPGVTTEGAYGSLPWRVSEGPDRYRRGLYTFSKRTAPYAMAVTFDAPSGEACVARRDVSNTPLQALTLLNDAVFVECAQALGRRLAKQSGPLEERVELLFRCCLTRPPSRDEADQLMRFYEVQKRRLENKELDAAALAGPGDGNLVERAAWTALARVLLNLDEAITKN